MFVQKQHSIHFLFAKEKTGQTNWKDLQVFLQRKRRKTGPGGEIT